MRVWGHVTQPTAFSATSPLDKAFLVHTGGELRRVLPPGSPHVELCPGSSASQFSALKDRHQPRCPQCVWVRTTSSAVSQYGASSIPMSFERTQIRVPSSLSTGTQPIALAVTSAVISSSIATATRYGDSTSSESLSHETVTLLVSFLHVLVAATCSMMYAPVFERRCFVKKRELLVIMRFGCLVKSSGITHFLAHIIRSRSLLVISDI